MSIRWHPLNQGRSANLGNGGFPKFRLYVKLHGSARRADIFGIFPTPDLAYRLR